MVKEKGYTLLECLVALALVGILSVLSITGLVAFHNHIRQQVVADGWRHRIVFARLMALHTGKPVTLCASANGMVCGGEWRDGQIIQQGDTKLAVFPPLPKKESLEFRAFPVSDRLTFQPWGLLKQQNGTLTWRQWGKWGKVLRIIVSKSGRVRLEDQVFR